MKNFHRFQEFANQELLWSPGDSEELYLNNLKTNYDKLKDNGWINHSFTYKYNSHGFRCNEFDASPSIVALGCSNTMGTGLPIEHTWSYILAENLNLTCFNLGVGGGANDTSFRLAYIWLELIKPKIVVLWNPHPDRIELLDETKNYTYQPINPDIRMPGSDWYKHWVSTSDNGELNKIKNSYAIAQLCKRLGIKFFSKEQILTEDFPYVLGNDRARDLLHSGSQSNLNIANCILDYL